MPNPPAPDRTHAFPAPAGAEPDLPRVGALLAGLNHELRTALNGVVGMLELLLDTPLDAGQRQLAATAQDSVESLLAVVENLIDFSLLDAGALPPRPGRIDLGRELEAAVAAQRATAAMKNARLRLHPVPACALEGDPEHLRRLAACLACGAMHMSADGQVAIRATLHPGADGRARLELALDVPATGEAAGALVHAVAAPDHPPADVLHRHGNGGLSLFLAARMARAVGGRVSAAPLEPSGWRLAFEHEYRHAGKPLGTAAVLLVEADAGRRAQLAHQLQEAGLDVDACADAGQALAALAQRQDSGGHALALLGRALPGMDGAMLGAAMRADPRCAGMRLAMLADEVEAGLAEQLEAQGFAALLAASVPGHILLETLQALLAPTPPRRFLAPAADSAAFSCAGRRVLVADDNPVNRQVARRMLEKLGCAVDVAEDGRQACALQEGRPYDLILMDCQMPVMDGWEATVHIRGLAGPAGRTPIVALTACSTPADRAHCQQAGMDDFISKPLRPAVLREVLARLVHGAAPSAPAGDELESVHAMFGTDFAELATLFRRDAPVRIAALRAGCAAGDLGAVAQLAHAFSGSAASMGASTLSRLCKDLELTSKAGTEDRLDRKVDDIEAEYHRISSKLLTMIESH